MRQTVVCKPRAGLVGRELQDSSASGPPRAILEQTARRSRSYPARGPRRSQIGYLISTAMELVRDLLESDVRWAAFAIFVACLLLGRWPAFCSAG